MLDTLRRKRHRSTRCCRSPGERSCRGVCMRWLISGLPTPWVMLRKARRPWPLQLARIPGSRANASSAFGKWCVQHRDGLFGHTAASRLLRADHPQSMRALVRMFGLPAFWPVIGELEHSLRTGVSTAEKVLAGGVWGYLSSNPEASRIFDEAMTSKAYGQVAGVVGAYDFSAFGVIGDIGGGRGHLLQRVLMSAPAARGVLFDQQHVVEQASGVRSDRLTLQAGDFFKGDLPVCDAYLLMEVIHDWNDEDATKILRNVRSAAPAHSKLLIIEAIIAEDPGLSWPKTLDLWMLAIGGKQRTCQEYAELFANAGFSFTRQIDTQAGVSIIEGIPA